MKNIYIYLSAIALSLTVGQSKGQVSFTSASRVYTQNFDAIGTSATAALPANWRVSKNAVSTSTVGNYATASSATEQIGGNGMLSTATDGIYNFGAGVPGTATDRAIGGLSALAGSRSVNAYLYLKNNGTTSINDFTISYNVEKYKNGTNTAGFSIQMYYSADGATWISAGSDFKTSVIGGDIDNNGFTTAPQGSNNVNATLNTILSAGNDVYLAWNYSVTMGTVTSNAQALALDDVSITANYSAVTPVTFTSFDATVENNQAKVTWTTMNEINMQGYELEKSNDGFKFTKLTSVPSYNTSTASQYAFIDISLFNGNNFYRIKSIEKSGYAAYSKTIRLYNGSKQSGISITPNIVTTGSFNMQMINLPKGKYQMAVYSNAGVPLLSKIINNEVEGSMSQTINLPAGTARGLYFVRFYGTDTNINEKIIVQ